MGVSGGVVGIEQLFKVDDVAEQNLLNTNRLT